MSDTRAIDSIIVVERYRRDLGDVASLARSIAELDLLHPIVVTPGNVLIAGERRLRAVQQLGWTEIPVHVVPLDEISRGELAENTERKDFLPSEIEAMRRAMLPKEREAAKDRMAEGGKVRKLSSPSDGRAPQTRDKIGAFAGVSGRTVEKIAKVVEAAESEPEKYGKLLSDMDRTGRVNGPYKRLVNMKQAEKIRAEPPPLPAGPFGVGVIDVPWPFEEGAEDPSGRGLHPYSTMSLAAIEALPIRDIFTENSILWMFITNYHLLLGSHLSLLKAYGFEANALLTWEKPNFGRGHWLREQTEHCIMAVRGKPVTTLTNQSTWLKARTGEHSEKPDEFYAMVESLCPASGYVDLFARKARPGWTAWGAEAPQDSEPETQIARADSPAPPKGQKRVWSETASPDIVNWPSREEWAKRRTTYYADHVGNVVCSRRLADYATPEEAAAARRALLELWRSLGREMREVKAAAGSEADRARRLDNCRYQRHDIRRVLRETLDAGLVPWRVNDIGSLDDAPSSFALLVERYRAGWAAAEEAYAAEIAATPVDDAAWQAELERRAGIDRRFDERDRAAAAA